MEANKVHFRHILLFFFRKELKAAEAEREICNVYGDNAVSESVCRKWFARFRSGNFNLEDAPRSGRPSEISDDEIKALIENDRHLTAEEIAKGINISATQVRAHLKAMGYVKKVDIWVPHELSEKNLMDRIEICESLLRWNKSESFLKRLVTGDEKWVTYNNIKRKKSWSKPGESSQTVAKRELHPQKILLCIWWDYRGVLYYELLPQGETIDSNKYCSQLSKLKRAINDKRPELANRKGVVFHHDNARPHTSLVTRQRLRTFDWEIMPHPPYSPDIAPSDYHLFRSLQNHLDGQKFNSLEDVKNGLDQFFAQKSRNFYTSGIMKLPERWQKIIDQNGQYIID